MTKYARSAADNGIKTWVKMVLN